MAICPSRRRCGLLLRRQGPRQDVDDLFDDTRDFVRKSPGVAIGIAAVAGFALMRVIKTGLDDVGRAAAARSAGARA